MKKRILILQSSLELWLFFQRNLRDVFELSPALAMWQARELLDQPEGFAAAVMDVRVHDGTTYEFMKEFLEKTSFAPIIAIAATVGTNFTEAVRAGCDMEMVCKEIHKLPEFLLEKLSGES